MTNLTIYIDKSATPDDTHFQSLQQAAEAFRSKESLKSGLLINVIFGKSTAENEKPKIKLFVDTKAGGVDGDGSELYPCADVSSALISLNKQIDNNTVSIDTGNFVQLKMRECFTSTEYESNRGFKESLAKNIFKVMAFGLIVPVFLILGYLTYKAAPAISLDFFIQNPKDNMTAGGIWAPMIGTFFAVIISLIIAAPIGVLAGVYLNEYASDNWFTRVINLAVINLAGVPSIVHGLFGVGAFVLFAGMGESLLAASATLAVMTLPVIITSTKEALASVPMPFREACWNLGATRWQTIRTIVLPNSISGILTGVILQVSRAAGETAPILFTGAVATKTIADSGLASFIPYALDEKFMALSYHLFYLRTQGKDIPVEYEFGTAVTLIGLVLIVNSLSIAFRMYLRSRKKW